MVAASSVVWVCCRSHLAFQATLAGPRAEGHIPYKRKDPSPHVFARRLHSCHALAEPVRRDVVVDVRLADGSGIEATSGIRTRRPVMRRLMLIRHDDLVRAIRSAGDQTNGEIGRPPGTGDLAVAPQKGTARIGGLSVRQPAA